MSLKVSWESFLPGASYQQTFGMLKMAKIRSFCETRFQESRQLGLGVGWNCALLEVTQKSPLGSLNLSTIPGPGS